MPPAFARYDRHQTYEWNYAHAPEPVSIDVPRVAGAWQFCGLRAASPLGIAAGPLLNGRWCLYYASLGFDVLTYKTVRSAPRLCYGLPNLQPVDCGPLSGDERSLPVSDSMQGSWAVSFGMPSKPPEVWRADVERTRRLLPSEKILSVSVVGTIRESWTIDELADDYACCARWAIESGADCIEANFSCPNVSTCDGQLYQQPDDAALVAQRVRAAIGSAPLILKVGHFLAEDDDALLKEFVEAVAPWTDALSMTNTIAATVAAPHGSPMFGDQPRGIAGAAIRDASLAQVRRFRHAIAAGRHALQIIGVGGAANVSDILAYLEAGAHAVHLATAAMLDPMAGIAIRTAWPR